MKYRLLLLIFFCQYIFAQTALIEFEKTYMTEDSLKKNFSQEELVSFQKKVFNFIEQENKKCRLIKGRSKKKKELRKNCDIDLIQFQKSTIKYLYRVKYKMAQKSHAEELVNLDKSRDELILELNKSLSKLAR